MEYLPSKNFILIIGSAAVVLFVGWFGFSVIPNSRLQVSSFKNEEGAEFIIGSSLKDLERDAIVRTLRNAEGNRTKTAIILGITRKTLQNKIKEYEITI